jgi:hypothetical protein
MRKQLLASVFSTAMGLVLTPSAFGATRTVETMIESTDVETANGGFNPDAFAYDVTATVYVGSNACDAAGATADIVQKKKHGVITLTPVKRVKRGAPRVCTREFAPVYQTVRVTVRDFASRVHDVVVKNVQGIGNVTSLPSLVGAADESAELALTGTLDQIAGIGGESTGWGLWLEDGTLVEVDLATNNLDRGAASLVGSGVTIRGHYRTVNGIETGTRRVLEASSLD